MTARKANLQIHRISGKGLVSRLRLELKYLVQDLTITVFARRLGSSVAFDYRIQFLSDGSVRFIFRSPPSLKVWRIMQYMDFQPEDRRNQIWVRKSDSLWSARSE